jgi:hypothetical protein
MVYLFKKVIRVGVSDTQVCWTLDVWLGAKMRQVYVSTAAVGNQDAARLYIEFALHTDTKQR